MVQHLDAPCPVAGKITLQRFMPTSRWDRRHKTDHPGTPQANTVNICLKVAISPQQAPLAIISSRWPIADKLDLPVQKQARGETGQQHGVSLRSPVFVTRQSGYIVCSGSSTEGRDAMKIKSKFANWMIARIGTYALRVLFWTVRVEHQTAVAGATPYEKPEGRQRYCFCLWHDAILACVYSLKTYNLGGLISRHQDGTYLAHAATLAGITPVRGSASRGGAQATRQLIDQPDLHVCITPDGPRGPRRVMKDGIVYLSSRTGRPVVPNTVIGTNCWSIPGGWSDMLLPKPFSKILLIAGTPIVIPEGISRQEISQQTERIQLEMDRLDLLGRRLVRGETSVIELIGQEGVYPADCKTDHQRAA